MVTVSSVLHEWIFILVKIGTLFLGKSSCEDGFGVVSFGHFEPQSYQNGHLNDTTNQKIAGVQCGIADRTISSVSFEKNGHHDISLHLEDFTDIENVNEEIIWRLLRVRCSKVKKLCQSVHL